MLEQLRSGFKSTINWNKYQSKISAERQNQNLNFLIDPSFQGVNWLFVLLFENEGDRKVHTGYYLPKVEIKDYNVKIVTNVFLISQLKVIWEHMITFEKFAAGHGDDYRTGCFLDYEYFNKHYKMIVID